MTVGERNLVRLIDAAFERHGDRESTFFEGRWHRSGDLHERSRRLAGGLVELGVRPGDRVAVHMSNCLEVGLTYSATWRAGAVATPAIFLLPPPELRHVLADSEARTVVTTSDLLAKVQEAAAGLDHLRHVVCLGGSEGAVAFEDLEQADPVDLVPRTDDDLAALLYTGGTTGRAKGVMLSHSNLWSCGRATYEAGHVEGVTRTLVPLPLAHSYGIALTVAGGFTEEAGTAVLMRWFDPDGFLRLVEEHRIQRTTVVPSMLQILLGRPLDQHDLSSLRIVHCGASPLAPETARAFEERVPNATVLEGYGCTETSGIAATNRPGRRRLGTVGEPLPGYELRILDDDGVRLPAGDVGEVAIRSLAVMQGYWRDPETTARALRDGWLHTGDLGRLDGDGYLTLVDRKKDLIIRGGFNVYPRDVEEALLEHPSVLMAGVVGRPDERYGEEVVAFVQLDPAAGDLDPQDLVAFARRRIGGYRYPREVRIVDAIPLTPVLKVDRKALRARLS